MGTIAMKRMAEMDSLRRAAHRRRAQQGFTLVEVSIVTALMILMAIVGLPAIQGYIIENRVPRVAQDLQRFVARAKVAALHAGSSPYAQIGNKSLLNSMREAAAVRIEGTGAGEIVAHGLGGRGVAGNGTITVTPESIAGLPAGSGFRISLSNVNHAACPSLAAVMQRLAVRVSVGTPGTLTVVKDSLATPRMTYNGVLADAQCKQGDVNQFEMVFQ